LEKKEKDGKVGFGLVWKCGNEMKLGMMEMLEKRPQKNSTYDGNC
jgi:hypothetical protein